MQEHTLLTPGLCAKATVDSFEAINDLSPVWQQEHEQLGKGRATVRVAFVTTGRLQLASIARSPGVRLRGATLGGTTAVGIPLHGPGLHLQRAEWAPGGFGYVSRGGEFEIVSPRPNRILALAVDGALFDEAARERFGAALPATLAGRCLRANGESERRDWSRRCSAPSSTPS